MNEKKRRADAGQGHLAEELSRLSNEAQPERDLWPAIAARLEERPAPWWRRVLPQDVLPANPWPALATLAVVAVLGAGLFMGRDRPIQTAATATPSTVVLAPVETSTALVESAHAEDGLLQLRRDLVESLERRRHELAPDSIAVLEETLAVLDQAIVEVRAALERDPSNVQLNRLLAAQYQREVGVLKALNRI